MALAKLYMERGTGRTCAADISPEMNAPVIRFLTGPESLIYVRGAVGTGETRENVIERIARNLNALPQQEKPCNAYITSRAAAPIEVVSPPFSFLVEPVIYCHIDSTLSAQIVEMQTALRLPGAQEP